MQKPNLVLILNKVRTDNINVFLSDLVRVNPVMKDQFYRIITILASIAYFIPVVIILLKKIWKDSYFLFLGLYWLLGAVVNFVTLVPGLSLPSIEVITVVYNMVDIPFVLWIFWYTSSSSLLAKILRSIIAIYVIIELLVVFKLGINYEAIKYVIGAGVLVVLITVVWEITLYLQRMEHNNREKSMLFIYAAFLFEYGSYAIVYIFDYFIIPSDQVDKFLIYYISTLVAITIACLGFLIRKNNRLSTI